MAISENRANGIVAPHRVGFSIKQRFTCMTTLNNCTLFAYHHGLSKIKKNQKLPASHQFVEHRRLQNKKMWLYDVYQQRSTRHTPHKNNQWEKTK
jgi:hypothetical protein